MEYVKCPRCDGHRMVFAYTKLGNGWQPSQGEYFPCPLCSGAAEVESEEADRWRRERDEEEGD